MEYEIEDLRHEDYEEVIALMKRYLPQTAARWEELYAWRFKNNPWTKGAPLGKCTRIDGRIASYQYMTSWPMWIEGESIMGYCSFDMLTDPTYRGKGVGRGVYQGVLDYSKIAPLLGTTANEVTGAVWLRRGAIPAPEADRSLYRVLSPLAVAMSAFRRRLGMDETKRPVSPSPRAMWTRAYSHGTTTLESAPVIGDCGYLASVWEDMKSSISFGTERSPEFLRWRYAEGGARPWAFALRDRGTEKVVAWYALWYRRAPGRFGFCTSWLSEVVANIEDRDILALVVRDALERASSGGAHLLEVRGMHLSIRNVCRSLGFRERQLPIASFLLNLPATRKPTVESWHVVAADADAILR